MGVCHIEPFEPEELKLFAKRWFLSQDPITAEQRSAEFLQQVSDSRLKDLVRNPLLASIAAVASTREPDLPLPTNRVDLYQRFYDYLVTDEEASGRATPVELRRLEHGQPARYKLAQWVHDHRIEIIDAMAIERLGADTQITDAAYAWVQKNRPTDINLPPGWEEVLDRLLIDTGMFVYESSGLRFLHHTLAEFLAARAHASTIPSDFPKMKEWFERGLKPSERNFVLMTLALWGRVAGNEIELVLRGLLEGGREEALLAGSLLAESETAGVGASRLVVDRLVDLAFGSALDGAHVYTFSSFDSAYRGPIRIAGTMSRVDRVFSIVSLLIGNQYASLRLRELIAGNDIPFIIRLGAVGALSAVATVDEAAQLLHSLSFHADQPMMQAIAAAGLIEMRNGPIGEYERSLIDGALADPRCDSETRAAIADLYMESGNKEEAVAVARIVASDDGAHLSEFRIAAKIIVSDLRDRDQNPKESIRDLFPRMTSTHQAEVTRELFNAGYIEYAHELADAVIADAESSSPALSIAVELRSKESNPGQIEILLSTLKRRPSWDSERSGILTVLMESGAIAPPVEDAVQILRDPSSQPFDIEQAINIWIAGHSSGDVQELMDILAARPYMNAWARANASAALAEGGHLEEAVAIARPVITDPMTDGFDLDRAAAVIRQAPESVQNEAIRSISESILDEEQKRVRSIEVLALLGNSESVPDIALEILQDRTIDDRKFSSVLESLIKACGVSVAERLVTALIDEQVPPLRLFQVADSLATIGALPHAVHLWKHIISSYGLPPLDAFTTLTRLINTDHRRVAINALQMLANDENQNSREIVRARGLLAWLIFSDPTLPPCSACTQEAKEECRICLAINAVT
ncbi:NACHT domain-containing protein [Streptomyces albospinus]|uniref:NACHT domain-containing protein n=1 Tax=Streptomyces albospinus TaxID=285515 RepID=UPI001670B57B|nr:hypothetical protein [Streptomyces albospinus]